MVAEGESEQPTAAAPLPEGPKKQWPSPTQLEKWLMASSKDADPSATFLRRMLQINPAYGSYLSSNEDLAELVMLFAKRFRSKMLQCAQPIKPDELYEPLLEVVWRVVGHTFHTFMELQENQNLPVPQMALGQIKMLLQTNEELSRQLKENRRAYLKELVLLREKAGRQLSTKAQRAVESLQEEPVMFYEPLSYVLDETTKEFVKEVVEERIKLEMRTPADDKNNDNEREMEDMENELKHLRVENKHLRAEAARNADKAKRLEEMELRAKEEAAQQKKLYLQKSEEYAQLEDEMKKLKDKLSEAESRINGLEADRKKSTKVAEDSPSNLTHQLDDLRSELDAALAKIAELQAQIDRLEQEKKELAAENQKWQDAMRKKESELEALRAQNEALSGKATGETVTTKVVKDDDALERLRDQHKQVEKELRATIKKLEQALEEERNKKKTVKKVKEEEDEDEIEKLKKKKKGGGFTEEELKEAVRKATDKLKEKLSDLNEEVERLQQENEEKDEEIKKLKKELKKALDGAGGGDADEVRRWKNKYEELLEKFEALESKHEALEHKVALLIEKLRQYGGEEAVAATLAEIKLDPPPVRPKRKKKAWERLYDDAVRRLSAAKAKAAKEKAEEEKELERLRRVVENSRNARKQVIELSNLQKAKQQSEEQYYDALARFTESNKDLLEEEVAVDENELESGLDFVCPRCDFRMQPRRRSPSPAPPSQRGGHVSFAQTMAPQPGEYTKPNVGFSFSQPAMQLNRTETFGDYQDKLDHDIRLSPSQRPGMLASQSTGNLGNTYDIAARDLHVRGVSPSRSSSQNRSTSPNRSQSPSGTLAASLAAAAEETSPQAPSSVQAPAARTLRHAATISAGMSSPSLGGTRADLVTLATPGGSSQATGVLAGAGVGGAFVTGAAAGPGSDGIESRPSGVRGNAAGSGSRSTSPVGSRDLGATRKPSPPRMQQMPWRQPAGGESAMYSSAPARDTGALPWVPQGGATMRLPPGWTKPGSPTQPVPGRVPSAGALEPLPVRSGAPTDNGSLSPRSRRGLTVRPASSGGFGLPASGRTGLAQRDRSPEGRRKFERRDSRGELVSERPLAATLTGGAGKAPPGLALSRSVPGLAAAAVLLPTTQTFSPPVGRSVEPQPGAAPTTDMKLRRMAQTLLIPTSPPIAGTEIPGQKFLVTPLVSQQSMAAGVPLPMAIPP